jgi:hypothetical protein
MSCPYFRESYFALCARSNSTYVPSIAEMEQYCFKDKFYFCPIIKASLAKKLKMRFDPLVTIDIIDNSPISDAQLI